MEATTTMRSGGAEPPSPARQLDTSEEPGGQRDRAPRGGQGDALRGRPGPHPSHMSRPYRPLRAVLTQAVLSVTRPLPCPVSSLWGGRPGCRGRPLMGSWEVALLAQGPSPITAGEGCWSLRPQGDSTWWCV